MEDGGGDMNYETPQSLRGGETGRGVGYHCESLRCYSQEIGLLKGLARRFKVIFTGWGGQCRLGGRPGGRS